MRKLLRRPDRGGRFDRTEYRTFEYRHSASLAARVRVRRSRTAIQEGLADYNGVYTGFRKAGRPPDSLLIARPEDGPPLIPNARSALFIESFALTSQTLSIRADRILAMDGSAFRRMQSNREHKHAIGNRYWD